MADAPHHFAGSSGYGAPPHHQHFTMPLHLINTPATISTAAILAESPLAAEYTQTVNMLAEKACQRISQLEQDATAKAREWARAELAKAHKWQSTVMMPDFWAKLARGDPEHVQKRLSLLREDIEDIQFNITISWVRCGFFHVLNNSVLDCF
jgi:hypothetical protein